MNTSGWSKIITPRKSLLDVNLREVWEYRDLIRILVRRDFVATYKQTVLGPLWFFISPLFTVLVYTFIFGIVAEIPSDGIPRPLFYMAGIALWSYFSACFTSASGSLVQNAHLFGKVYFPRLTVPLALIFSNLVKFAIQLVVLGGFLAYFILFTPFQWKPGIGILLLPFWVIIMAGLSLGLGLLLASITTKYRDFTHFVSFGINLLMYATPIIYPISFVPDRFKPLLAVNPLAPVIEGFKAGLFGTGEISVSGILYSVVFTVIALILGVIAFNRVEQNFTDTV